jgi:hypothetical protein
MSWRKVYVLAMSLGLATQLGAQKQDDAQFVADNLKYSREFYSNVHLAVIAQLPRSFAYDRYPYKGPERIRCDEGTFARKHGKPWVKS